MTYQKFCYWVDTEGLENFKKTCQEKAIHTKEETRIPCRVLRNSKELIYLNPSAWDGFCRRRTSWYWKSEKAGKTLIISYLPLNDLNLGDPIIIKQSNFKPVTLPSFDELKELIKSDEYKKRKPHQWEKVEQIEIEFYRTWFERYKLKEVFDFEKIFIYHSANHANFIDPSFFLNRNGLIIPYSISDSFHVCSSCMEFFDIIGDLWLIKYVVPCIGAVLFAHLPIDNYFEVKKGNGPLTQEVEYLPFKQGVVGSSPARPT